MRSIIIALNLQFLTKMPFFCGNNRGCAMWLNYMRFFCGNIILKLYTVLLVKKGRIYFKWVLFKKKIAYACSLIFGLIYCHIKKKVIKPFLNCCPSGNWYFQNSKLMCMGLINWGIYTLGCCIYYTSWLITSLEK